MGKGSRIMRACLLAILSLSCLLAAACSKPTGTTTAATGTSATTGQTEPDETTRPVHPDIPLVIAVEPFAAEFSPFFVRTESDREVVMLTSLSLLTTDRGGAVVRQAIKGETRPYGSNRYFYQGIADVETSYDADANETEVTWTLRDDLLFSDGEPVTADDVIFSYYVFLDPSYPLQTELRQLPIRGLVDYQRQISKELYDRYEALSLQIYSAGEAHSRSVQDSWSEAQQQSFWQHLRSAWITEIEAIVAYVFTNERDHAEQYTGYLPAEIDREGRKVVLAMTIWDFASVADDGYLVGAYTDKAWNLPGDIYPTAEDFYEETRLFYAGNPEAFWSIEAVTPTPVLTAAQQAFIREWAQKDESMGGQGVRSISGISKIDERTVSVTISGYDPAAAYKLNIPVAPLHYYGNPALYDDAAGQYGFPLGDLSAIEARTNQPLGGGPYRFEQYQDKTVYLVANELYYKGQPEIVRLQLKETAPADQVASVGSGITDLVALDMSPAAVAEILRYNQNQDLDGSRIVTCFQTEPAYSYIGLNAAAINVAADPASEASRQLRTGLAILLNASRLPDDAASVSPALPDSILPALNWPVYTAARKAYETDLTGLALYSGQMTAAQKRAMASAAAVSFLESAGYTADAAGKRLIAAPEGAELDYSLLVMDSVLAHPVTGPFLETAVAAFSAIGVTLDLEVMDDPERFASRLENDEVELWFSVRQMTAEPDFFSAYHSKQTGRADADSPACPFNLTDQDLDALIEAAALIQDPLQRQQNYQESLIMVLDWAVEVPLYLQQSLALISPQRIDRHSVAADMTGFWNWRHEIEKLRLPVP